MFLLVSLQIEHLLDEVKFPCFTWRNMFSNGLFVVFLKHSLSFLLQQYAVIKNYFQISAGDNHHCEVLKVLPFAAPLFKFPVVSLLCKASSRGLI